MTITVSVSRQQLVFAREGRTHTFAVSTSRYGVGECNGSYRTPRGRHYVRAKIGQGLVPSSVLRARRPTGEVCMPDLLAVDPSHDWITSRILWLCGRELGVNRLGKVDTMARYIYIHGTPHTKQLGIAASSGCVRMADSDVIELFKLVQIGEDVVISED